MGTEKIIDDLCHQSRILDAIAPTTTRKSLVSGFLTIAKPEKPRLAQIRAA